MKQRPALAAAVLTAALHATALAAGAAPPWRGDLVGRLQALALLQTLNADLLAHDSATLTLDRWCAAHNIGSSAPVVADRVPDAAKPVTPAQRSLLAVGPDEAVRYRRVRLRCGGVVLSEADNWYVPSRLTPAMNAALDGSDIAFGRAVQPLHFTRRTLDATLLWSPLPADWATAPAPPATSTLDPAPAVIEHRAVLTLPDGTPFSTVVETYTRAVLDFPEPKRP